MDRDIRCPNCGTVFTIDEASYADIARQVRDKEFHKELEDRKKQFDSDRESAVELAKAETEKSMREELEKLREEGTKNVSERDARIAELEAKLSAGEDSRKLAVNEAVSEKDKRISELEHQLEDAERDKKTAAAEADTAKELELSKLREQNSQTISSLNTKIQELEGNLKVSTVERENSEKSIRDEYERRLKDKQEEVDYYKDLKSRQSTKMVGETLEQHCEIEFNKIRATAFPNAYFEKDNDASGGSKGDYIYRETDDDGVEILSIMFEMKNQMEDTAESQKHKNEDFFKKLDKDRRTKNCEYAVLVSLLEEDSELYNTGIVDVSYRYPKMYVIRPQFFIPMITILRNAAMNALDARRELARVREQNIDVSNFEEQMMNFKTSFGKSYKYASDRFIDAIDKIDSTIRSLEKVKDNLRKAADHLNTANNKAEDLSIKKLTRNNPTMQAKFEALKAGNDRAGGRTDEAADAGEGSDE